MGFWTEKRVLVTGGSGFLGSFVVERVQRTDCAAVVYPSREQCDLRDRSQVQACLADARPDIVIHLAGVVGGIAANIRYPARFFYDNAAMALHVTECAHQYGVEKFVTVGPMCAYPKHASMPLREEEFWNGYPEETNAAYAHAKRMLLAHIQACRQQYGFPGVYLLLANLYGPRDNFDPEHSHVIPALIRRFDQAARAGTSRVTVWGSGRPSREFLYVEDAADAALAAVERYDDSMPLNVGSGEEVTIQQIAEWVARLTGFEGEIVWDQSRPDGQMRRVCSCPRATALLGFRPRVPLREGLARTVAWYVANVSAGLVPEVTR